VNEVLQVADEQNDNVEETPTVEPEAEEAPNPEAEEPPPPEAEEPPAPEAEEAAAPGEPVAAEGVPELTPKERKRRAKAAKAADVPAKGPRTPQERSEERIAERRRKATERRTGRHRARDKARARETALEATPPRVRQPGVQKTRQGVVVSDRADKTISVRIDITRRHRRYGKIVRTSNTLHAHDERNDAHIGDTVIVREARPVSRTKRWRLIEVVERAK
jgi:small subunit ribosomal protein S17